MPPGFSWVDPPHIAALGFPSDADDLAWLREEGIDVLVSLSEDPPPRHWVNEAGLLGIHLPVRDMTAPSQTQLMQAIEAMTRAVASGMGVAVHCTAGLGRTGTVLASYFVQKGLAPGEAMKKVRGLRPGSIETDEQERAILEFARGL